MRLTSDGVGLLRLHNHTRKRAVGLPRLVYEHASVADLGTTHSAKDAE
jgi:hypothetical protein